VTCPAYRRHRPSPRMREERYHRRRRFHPERRDWRLPFWTTAKVESKVHRMPFHFTLHNWLWGAPGEPTWRFRRDGEGYLGAEHSEEAT